ncbi:hypothetical protein SAMN06297144_1595 [Sphingomonas guangdongensis]|uniref:Cupin domain-containing protein n=1 Tax=Sphingomonas guangdongensis TaxID=1141890 RepID=A0A285QWZ8_9SPHN|nr:hypothetical protein [Sphingomonas guangdongensis]SOB86490.1 hypothetical protein SAMN06297144_1595 [Sphingomonas guangdongensis]
MLASPLAWFLLIAAQQVPAVPGGCSEPADQHVGEPGCFLTTEVRLGPASSTLYWHIIRADSEATARALAKRARWQVVVKAHGRWWLYVLSPARTVPGVFSHHVAGPFVLPAGPSFTARFMESWFPPGMRTRVHSHSGPEAFYVVEGEQCTETPKERRLIRPGESYTVAGGAHLQAAPKGRRSLVLILAPDGEPWMRLANDWTGSDFCR